MELALAIVRDFNGWLALAIVALASGIGAAIVNRRWANVADAKDLRESNRKQYELETERAVKLSIPPKPYDGPQLEHRVTDAVSRQGEDC